MKLKQIRSEKGDGSLEKWRILVNLMVAYFSICADPWSEHPIILYLSHVWIAHAHNPFLIFWLWLQGYRRDDKRKDNTLDGTRFSLSWHPIDVSRHQAEPRERKRPLGQPPRKWRTRVRWRVRTNGSERTTWNGCARGCTSVTWRAPHRRLG